MGRLVRGVAKNDGWGQGSSDRIAAVQEWPWLTDAAEDTDQLRLSEQFCDWSWRSRYGGGPFDFRDEADFRRGIELFSEMVRKRYGRSRSCQPLLSRQQFAWRPILYRLKAKIDMRPLAEEEVKATG